MVSTVVNIWAVYHDFLIIDKGITFSMTVTPIFRTIAGVVVNMDLFDMKDIHVHKIIILQINLSLQTSN